MSVGFNTILRIRRIEEDCAKMGFRLGHSKHGNYHQEFGDILSISPKDDALPIYCRDAELFNGTLDDLERWMQGAQWMKQYLEILRLIDDKKIARKEQDERNRQLMRILKNEDNLLKDRQ